MSALLTRIEREIPVVVHAETSCQGVSLSQDYKVAVLSLQIVNPDTDRDCSASCPADPRLSLTQLRISASLQHPVTTEGLPKLCEGFRIQEA